LQTGGNILDFEPQSTIVNTAVEDYQNAHPFEIIPKLEKMEVEETVVTEELRKTPIKEITSPKNSIISNTLSTLKKSTEGGDDITVKANRDANILKRVHELQKEGLWAARRTAKVSEPSRIKTHWDYLLEEMSWMSNDFKEERKWKQALARKISKAVMKYHRGQELKEKRRTKEEELNLKRIASKVARSVKKFWSQMEKLVVSKHQAKVDEKKKQVLDKHLNFLVDQTERYSRMLAKDITRANLINDISTSENRKEKEIIINVENQTNTMEIDETSKKII